MTHQIRNPIHEKLLSQARERLQAVNDAIPRLTALVAERRAHLDSLTRPRASPSPYAKGSKEATQGAPKMLLKQAEATLAVKEAEVRAARDHLATVERCIAAEEAAATAGK